MYNDLIKTYNFIDTIKKHIYLKILKIKIYYIIYSI